MAQPKVVIVGAGPGGLAAALQAAKAGAQVTIIEKQAAVGGRTSTLHQDGFKFDLGPTFFLYPRVLEEIFASLNLDLWSEVPMKRLDPQYRVSFGAGGHLDATPNIAEMEQQIAQLAPQDVGGLSRYMSDNRVKLQRFRPILESPFQRLSDLMRLRFLPAVRWLRPWRSLADELGTYFSDPRLMIAFSFQSKYLGMSPFKCPSLFSILSFLEYEHGVFHPYGGCGQVSQRMADIARQMGVDIRLSESVTGFEFRGRRPVAVQTDAGQYACDSVVINADFAEAMRTMVPDHLRRRWTDSQLAKKKFSCSTFMLYLGIRGSYDQLPHHSIHIAKDYAKNLREIEQDFVLPEDPSFYVQNAGVTDSSLAPAGCSGLYVLVPVPHQKLNDETGGIQWDEATRQRFRARTLEQLKQIGVEDIEQRIITEKMITPADWQSDYSIYRGATFNLAHGLDQMLHLRPHNRFEDLDGVYLVGGGTHPGSGLPVIYESSRITCKQMLPDLGLDCQFIHRAQAGQGRSTQSGAGANTSNGSSTTSVQGLAPGHTPQADTVDCASPVAVTKSGPTNKALVSS
ncbi:MAG: phytoene desaturase [Pirellulaceae bacterium]|nr:phytoene desaturase [Pirellulaceae bacterium]